MGQKNGCPPADEPAEQPTTSTARRKERQSHDNPASSPLGEWQCCHYRGHPQAGMIRREAYHLLPQSGRARVEVFARLWYLLAVDAYLALEGMTEAGYSADAALGTLEEVYRPWLATSLDDAIEFGKQL